MVRIIALVLVAATLTASLAEAQTVSYDRLAFRLNAGDRITVTNSAGQELQGRFVDLSSSTLSLQADGRRHDLNRSDVSTVQVRHRDSLKNGALLGFMLGAVAGAGLVGRSADAYPVVKLSIASLFGGAGAGIGVGVDALHQGSKVVYRASPSNRRLAVSPVLSRERHGLSVSFGF